MEGKENPLTQHGEYSPLRAAVSRCSAGGPRDCRLGAEVQGVLLEEVRQGIERVGKGK